MKLSRTDSDDDWTFGRGLANYISKAEAVRQNVATRIRSFKNDWFLDVDAHIDWINLLGRKGTDDQIVSEIERVTLSTEGVMRIDSIEIITDIVARSATIRYKIVTIYDTEFEDEIGVIA